MLLNTEQKIKRYHSEEIMLILFICASDLSNYNKEDLVIFTECIEGRVENLFEPNYLLSLNDFFKINLGVLQDFDNLKNTLVVLYSGGWHNKMKDKERWDKINILAIKILKELSIGYAEPIKFMENHLNLD